MALWTPRKGVHNAFLLFYAQKGIGQPKPCLEQKHVEQNSYHLFLVFVEFMLK